LPPERQFNRAQARRQVRLLVWPGRNPCGGGQYRFFKESRRAFRHFGMDCQAEWHLNFNDYETLGFFFYSAD
jgi:hypothetical protein